MRSILAYEQKVLANIIYAPTPNAEPVSITQVVAAGGGGGGGAVELEGDAYRLGNLNASAITHGTIDANVLPAMLSELEGDAYRLGNLNASTITHGTIDANVLPPMLTELEGDAYRLGNLNASAITHGTLSASAVPSALDVSTVRASGNVTAGAFVGDGAFLTNIQAQSVTGLSAELDTRLAKFQSAKRLYVSTAGLDTNAGTSPDAPLRTIKKACELAASGVTILVESGSYTEQNPIVVPSNVAIVGDNLRRVLLYAANPRCDYFHVNNLSYLWGLRFVNLQRPAFCVAFPCATADCTVQNGQLASVSVLYSPAGYTEAPAVYVEPPDSGTTATATAVLTGGVVTAVQITGAGSGYTQRPHISIHAPTGQRPFVTGSPYIQNCSSITGPFDTAGNLIGVATPLPYDENDVAGSGRVVDPEGAGGGIRIDGIVCHPSSPLRSFVADAFTQVNQGGPGHLCTNMGYAQFVSCFTTFCTYSFKASSGSSCNISNSVSDFGLYGLVAKGYWHAPFTTGSVAATKTSSVSSVAITDGGSGYAVAPAVSLVGGGGTGATAEALVDGGKVVGVVVTDGGSGYKSAPTVAFSEGAATAVAALSGTGPITVQMPTYRKPDIGSAMLLGGQWYTVVGSSPTATANEYDVSFFPQPASVTAGTDAPFHAVSSVSTGSHVMEYVGSGCTYNALPEYGGVPVAGNEVLEVSPGRCYYTTNDHLGNAKVGKFFQIEQATGTVTISTDRFNLAGLNSIGPFRRNGVGVGVQLQEVSNNPDLIASTGAPDATTVPTQRAVKTYVDARTLPSGGNASLVLAKASDNDYDVAWSAIDKASVGLANVIDATQLTAAEKGVANGVASLDANAQLVASQLPANAQFTDVRVGDVSLNASNVMTGNLFATNLVQVRLGTNMTNVTPYVVSLGGDLMSLGIFSGLRYGSSYSGGTMAEKFDSASARWGMGLYNTNDLRLYATGVGTTGRVILGHALTSTTFVSVLTVARNNTSTTSGNVGINTLTPQDALHVVGNVRATTFVGNVVANSVTTQTLGFDSLSKTLPERLISERRADVAVEEHAFSVGFEGSFAVTGAMDFSRFIACDPVSGRLFSVVYTDYYTPFAKRYHLVMYDPRTQVVTTLLTTSDPYTNFVYVPKWKKVFVTRTSTARGWLVDPSTGTISEITGGGTHAVNSMAYDEANDTFVFATSTGSKIAPASNFVQGGNWSGSTLSFTSAPLYSNPPLVIPNANEYWFITNGGTIAVVKLFTTNSSGIPAGTTAYITLPFTNPGCMEYSPVTGTVMVLSKRATTDQPFFAHVNVATRDITPVVWNDTLSAVTDGYGTLAYDARNATFYAIPYNATRCLQIDPVTNAVTPVGPVLSGTAPFYQGYAVGSTGDVWAAPYKSSQLLKIQVPKTTRATTHDVIAHNSLTVGGNLACRGSTVTFARTANIDLPRAITVRPVEFDAMLVRVPAYNETTWGTYSDMTRPNPLFMPAYDSVGKHVYAARPLSVPTFNKLSLAAPYAHTLLGRLAGASMDTLASLAYVPPRNKIYSGTTKFSVYDIATNSMTETNTTGVKFSSFTFLGSVSRLMTLVEIATGSNMQARLYVPEYIGGQGTSPPGAAATATLLNTGTHRLAAPPVVVGATAWIFTTDDASSHLATCLSFTATTLTQASQISVPGAVACALYVESIDRILCLTDGRNATPVSLVVIDPSDGAVQTAAWDDPLANTELAYKSMALHANTGLVYAVPFNATRVLTIRPTGADPSTWTLQTVGPEFAGTMKWYGAIYEGDEVFGVPYQTNALLKVSQYRPSSVAADSHLVLSNAAALSNVQPVSDAVAKLANVRGYTYEYGTSGLRAAGLLASDVANVLPEAVVTASDDSTAMDYAGACALLVEAVNELASRVAALEAA